MRVNRAAVLSLILENRWKIICTVRKEKLYFTRHVAIIFKARLAAQDARLRLLSCCNRFFESSVT